MFRSRRTHQTKNVISCGNLFSRKMECERNEIVKYPIFHGCALLCSALLGVLKNSSIWNVDEIVVRKERLSCCARTHAHAPAHSALRVVGKLRDAKGYDSPIRYLLAYIYCTYTHIVYCRANVDHLSFACWLVGIFGCSL